MYEKMSDLRNNSNYNGLMDERREGQANHSWPHPNSRGGPVNTNAFFFFFFFFWKCTPFDAYLSIVHSTTIENVHCFQRIYLLMLSRVKTFVKRNSIVIAWTAKSEHFENVNVIHISCTCIKDGWGVSPLGAYIFWRFQRGQRNNWKTVIWTRILFIHFDTKTNHRKHIVLKTR